MKILKHLQHLGGLAAIAALGFAVARAEPMASAPTYLKFEPLIVPVYAEQGATGLLAVRVVLEARDDSARQRLDRLRPRLIDGWTVALVDHARLHVDPNRPLDMPAIAASLEQAATRIGHDDVRRVYLIEAGARPSA